ncbi:MAG: hypothetical protein WCT05_07415 [Lentisphaeria bacterium]
MAAKEGWLLAVWKFVLWAVEKFIDIAHFCLEKLLAENVHFELPAALLIFLLTMIMIGSGCWSASIALSRRHSGWLHFLIGAFLPGVYPLVIMFTMGLKGERQRKKKMAAERQAQECAAEEKKKVLELQGVSLEEVVEAEDAEQFNARYFAKIARDAGGNKAGPWKVIFAGHEVVVQEILEAQEDFVLVLMDGSEGTNQKLRIPYTKIESWRDYY